MKDVLTQNELDALVNHGEETDGDARIVTKDNYEVYDLASGMHRVKGWSHDIKIVDERIQTNLSIRLLGILHKSVEVRRGEIQISKYGAWAPSVEVPSSINIYGLRGMMGYSAIVLDSHLVHALVNSFFGGGTRQTELSVKDFTHTEQRVIQLILNTIIETIKESWKELSEVDFVPVESEVNPEHLDSYSDSDVLMVRPFSLEFSGGGGEIQLIIPGVTADSIFRRKKSGVQSGEISAREFMTQKAMNYVADITGELTGAKLTLGEVFRLAEGDIISVDSPEKVDVKVNGVAKFKAKMGEIGGRVCLRVMD